MPREPSPERKQEAARRAWRNSTIGKLIEQARRSSRSSSASVEKLEQAIEEMERYGLGTALSSLQGESFDALLAAISEIMKSGSAAERILLREFLAKLGPVGSVLSALASAVSGQTSRRSTGDQDVDAARDFLESIGNRTLTPPNLNSGSHAKDIQTAVELLRENGYEVDLSTRKIREPSATEQERRRRDRRAATMADVPDKPPKGDRSPGFGMIEVDMGGRTETFPAGHPIASKAPMRVIDSSNLWSVQYDVDSWRLWIQYQNPKTKENPTKRAGPRYVYAGVPPDVFLELVKASSKGEFIWDRIRIRGTVSGHQFDYRLVSVRGYVPRKASLVATKGKNGLVKKREWYLKRTVRTINKRTGRVIIQQSRSSEPASQR